MWLIGIASNITKILKKQNLFIPYQELVFVTIWFNTGPDHRPDWVYDIKSSQCILLIDLTLGQGELHELKGGCQSLHIS